MWTKTGTESDSFLVWKAKRPTVSRNGVMVDAVKSLRRYELQVVREFVAVYRRFIRELLQDLEAIEVEDVKSLVMPRVSRQVTELHSVLAQVLQGIAKEVMSVGMSAADKLLGSTSQFADTRLDIPPEWYEWYRLTVEQALYRYTQEDIARIASIVSEGVKEGKSVGEITDTIQKIVLQSQYWRAERVARTEVLRLFNLGYVGVLVNEPVIVGFEYSVVLDARTSTICRPLAGRVVRKSELTRVPPLHPNCRTVLLPVFSGEEGNYSDERGEWVSRSELEALAKQFGIIPAVVLQAWQRYVPRAIPTV
jgi:SPP1 gp7 family putative phage head morphogenesis protein